MATKQTQSRNVKYQEPDKENMSHKRPPSGNSLLLKNRNSSSLEILDPEENGDDRIRFSNNRPSSSGKRNGSNHGNVGSVPPRNDSSLLRRTPTPTKQISLQAVRRREDRDEPIVADIDYKELQSHIRTKGRKEDLSEQLSEMKVSTSGGQSSSKSSIPFSYTSRHHNCDHHHQENETKDKPKSRSKTSKEVKEAPKPAQTETGAVGGTTESSSESESEEEEEERKAPNQLLMEFLSCLMEKDYQNAQKLCKMVLLYEPDNPEALKFQPLIDEKIELDNQPEPESDSDIERDDDEIYEEDDDDDDDDDSEDSDSDSETSDSDSTEDEDDNEVENRLDSGIASAAGSVSGNL